MTISPDDIGQFFTGYAGAFNRALNGDSELAAIAGHFAACFVESIPNGVTCAANGNDFMKALEKGYGYYRSTGTKEMAVTGVDSYLICAGHSVATVHWRGAYLSKDMGDIAVDFDVHYLLRQTSGALKIFGFIAGDEQAALRKAGIIENRAKCSADSATRYTLCVPPTEPFPHTSRCPGNAASAAVVWI